MKGRIGRPSRWAWAAVAPAAGRARCGGRRAAGRRRGRWARPRPCGEEPAAWPATPSEDPAAIAVAGEGFALVWRLSCV